MGKDAKAKDPKEAAGSSPGGGGMGGRGSMGGGLSASAVDTDKLWRDRIRQELQFQRQWKAEYGFMVANPSNADAAAAGATTASSSTAGAAATTTAASPTHSRNVAASLLNATGAVGATASTVNINEIAAKDLLELQRVLQHAQYTSTAQDSYRPLSVTQKQFVKRFRS